MLHDPRHDKKPSLAGFALFVASKEPDEKYNWRSCKECAAGQYLLSLGRAPQPFGFDWTDGLIITMNRLGMGEQSLGELDESQWTFGQLADRIFAYQLEVK